MINHLRQRRQELNLTQKQVADRVGIAESSYQRYERNARLPIVNMAVRIAKALETTVEELYIEEE
mgnify:CR=1 FL=1